MSSFGLDGFAWPDMLGAAGVVLILIVYAAAVSGRMRMEDPRYSLANLVGAAAILVSLFYSFNLASFIIEIAWLIISAYGLWRSMMRSKPAEDER